MADELDLPQHVLRFWESRFRDIKPMKRGGGRRYYRPDDIDLLRGIRHLLYGEGYTIRGVQRILREQGAGFVQAVWRDGATQPPHAGDRDVAIDDHSDDDHTDDDHADDEVSIDATMTKEMLLEPRGLGGRLSSLIGRDLGDRGDDVETRRDPPLQSAPMPRVAPDDRLGHAGFDRRAGLEPIRQEPARQGPIQKEPTRQMPVGLEPVRPGPAAAPQPPRPIPAATIDGLAPQSPHQAQGPTPPQARGLSRDDVRKLHAALHELSECRKLIGATLTRRG